MKTSTEVPSLNQQDFYDRRFQTIVSPQQAQTIRRFYVEKMIDILAENTVIDNGSRILEIGTGQGRIMEMMSEHFSRCHLEGIDISAKNVLASRAKGLKVDLNDANRLETTNHYDFIYGTAILHHLDDLSSFFASVFKMLKSKGSILFGPEPVWYALGYILYHKLRGSWDVERGMMKISATSLKRYLTAAGFSGIRIYRYGTPFMYFSKSLGRFWNMSRLSKIAFLNDIYIYAQK